MQNIKKITSNSFIKNVLLVTGGTAVAQVINILLSPIITRLYPPEQYGIFTAYSAIIGMLSILGSFRYEATIAIADDDNIAANMFSISVLVLTINNLIISLILSFMGEYMLGLFNGQILYKYRYLIPIGLYFIGLYNISLQWAFRSRDFKSISKTKFRQSIMENVFKVVLGIASFGPVGLIVGKIVGQSAGFFNLSKSLIKGKRFSVSKVNKKDVLWGIKRYKKFPLFATPSQFLNAAGLQLPILFFTSFFGNKVTGLYGLANSIINLPFDLIGRSISDVFYSEAAHIGKSDPKRLRALSRRLFKKLALIGLVPMIIIILLAPWGFTLVFGKTWYEAGLYARLIAILVYSRFIFMPVSRVYEVYERQKEAFLLDTMRIMLVLLVFIISKILSLNSYWTIGIYSIAMSFVYLNTYIMSQKILNDEIKKLKINNI